MVRRGSTVRVRQRALQRASKMALFLAQEHVAADGDLSPKPVLNLWPPPEIGLEQTPGPVRSTSVEGRGSIVPPLGTARRLARESCRSAGVRTLIQASEG